MQSRLCNVQAYIQHTLFFFLITSKKNIYKAQFYWCSGMLGTLTIPRGMSMVKALVPTLLGFVCYLSHINRTVEICVHYIQDNKNRKCEVHPKTLTVTVFPFLEFKNNPLVSLFSPRQSLVVIQYLERS